MRLVNCNGSVSWRQVAANAARNGNIEPMSADSISMALLNLLRKTAQSLPKLNKANKMHCLWWAQHFWTLRQSAICFWHQVTLAHMDEKWFWSVIVHRNLKSMPFLGVALKKHNIQHKSQFDEILDIASTAFAPKGNKDGEMLCHWPFFCMTSLMHHFQIHQSVKWTSIHQPLLTHKMPWSRTVLHNISQKMMLAQKCAVEQHQTVNTILM